MISDGINTLKQCGVKNGDRIAYKGSNSVEWVAWNLSCYAVGGIWVPMYSNQSANYCNHVIQDCQPKLVIADLNIKHNMTSNSNIDNNDIQFLHNALQNNECPDINIESPNEIASLIYTSGTTGNPKGVVGAPHRALLEDNLLFNPIV